jgi:hypothetical protein
MYPKGRRGPDRASMRKRARHLLLQLIANKATERRLDLITEEFLLYFRRGTVHAISWRDRPGGLDELSRDESRSSIC